MSLNNPYIARKQATEFAQDIKSSIQHPNINPILHYAYGIGGIGKTTLLERIHQEYSPDFQCIKVSFDKAVNHNVYVGSPIELMELIDREISDNAFLRVSPFQKVLQRYKQTLASLETEPIEGEQVTPEQIEEVKRLARGGARAIGFIAATQTDGGIAKGKLGKHEEAIADLNRAIELNPDDSQTWLIRGGAKGNLGRHEEAIADLDRAIELNSDDPSAWRSRGISNGRLGRYEEAIADLDRAIELNPNDSDARIDRGSANSNLGRYEEAIADLDRATELNSDDPDAWNVKALTMSIRSDFDKATADIDKAMELSPEKVAYVANKGIILARKNEFDAAKNCIEQAESMNSDSEFVYYAKACYFALQNNDRQAIENLRKAIEIDPVHCRREAKKNHDFDRLRDNSEFLALIER